MRLYFHLVGDAGVYWDRSGIEVENVEHALAEALQAVEEIREEEPTAPEDWLGWTLNITDASLSAGAGFVVAIAGSMMLMPGLGKTPQAQKLDVDGNGNVIGMDY